MDGRGHSWNHRPSSPPSQVLVPEDQRESSEGFLLTRKTEVSTLRRGLLYLSHRIPPQGIWWLHLGHDFLVF